MFRHRVRPPLPPLDEVTAERLLRGAPIEDLPDAYQPLGQLLADARRPATDAELEGSAAAAATFVAAQAANQPRRRVRSVGASALFALTIAVTTGTAVAATQGALPQPIQQVAHEALGAVGISVPGIHGDDHDDDRGTGPADVDGPAGGVSVIATTAPAADPSATTAPADVTTPGSSESGDTGGGEQAPQGVAGENPNAGPGNNAGQGNPTPGEGNHGTPATPGTPARPGGGEVTHPEPPADHLPGNGTGKGIGPPQVPPGQAGK
jgi:hypothetical protein